MSAEDEKYQIGTKSGSILWDISKLKRAVNNGNYKIKKVNVKELIKYNSFNGNPDYAMETDINIPCIIVELCQGKDKLIDGNHRLFKASKLGLVMIECYYLTEPEHIKYIINFDKETYIKVVKEF